MITIEFSDEDRAALGHGRYHEPHAFVRQKMEVLWLKSQGVAHSDICRLAGVCSSTLTTYVREYQEGGIEALKKLSFRRPRSDLEDHRDMLEAYFREHPPASAKQAIAAIERLTGLKRSPGRVRAFLKRIGMKCRKTGMIPAKADATAQDDFKKNRWDHAWKKPRPENAPSSSSMPRTSF
jgi:transposase